MENSVICASANSHGEMDRRARGGIIETLIETARRQETLIDELVAAVDSGDKTAILDAARKLAGNRRKDTPPPARKPGRKSKLPIRNQ